MHRKTVAVIGITILAITYQAWAGRPIPDTGQILCFSTAGDEVLCSGKGQDGAYTINPMSFTKLDAAGRELSDGAAEWAMVRDNVTGLVWEIKENEDGLKDYSNPHDADNTYTWYDPDPDTNSGDSGTMSAHDTSDFLTQLNDANFGGYNNWRLPTRTELRSIEDFSISEPGPTIDSTYFPHLITSTLVAPGYWSATSAAHFTDRAWGVGFKYGGHYGIAKSDSGYVLAVRGGEVPQDGKFTNNNDGTVTDQTTGLMWRQTPIANMEWQAALDQCENLTAAEYTDWRAPTIKELESILDDTENDPVVDPIFFPETTSSDYWSSTTYASSLNSTWGINFTDGEGFADGSKSLFRSIHAVRGGQKMITDNLAITTPRQASCWDVGSVMPITWDPAGISGNVDIYFSPEGGKPNTFESLALNHGNSGQFDWQVQGPATVNGYLEIIPQNDGSRKTSLGFFAIDEFIHITPESHQLSISEQPGGQEATFNIRLAADPVADVTIPLYSSNISQFTVSPATAVLRKGINAITGVTVKVTAVDDELEDGDYSGSIRTGAAGSLDITYDGMEIADLSITVSDDDSHPVTIESVQPSLVEIDQPFTLVIKGTGLAAPPIEDFFLVLQKENEEPDWNHQLNPTTYTLLGAELLADFPAPDTTGNYLFRIVHSNGFVELKGAVTVAEPADVAALQKKKAILVAGREHPGDVLWNVSMNSANRAYKALRFQGFSDQNIQYLTHMDNIDVDGDAELDKDGDPTHAALQSAVTTWAADAEELIIYMVDHGGEELFHLDYGDHITADELKTWLDGLQQTRAMRVIVIVDACMSGSFLNGLAITDGVHAQSERIVIAGAGPNEPAWFQNEGGISFSRYFWDTAYMTGRLFRSYISGRDHMVIQHPLADRDGNGSADEITLVGLFNDPASEILIGRGRIAASTPPEIGGICNDQTIECESSATITASDIVFYNGELSVIARILPPTYDAEPSDEPVEELPAIKLTDSNQDGTYTGEYGDFSRTGVYRVVVFATDKEDMTSVPKITRVVRACGSTNIKGDLNKDTETNLTDAVIALKVLAGTSVTGLRTDYTTAGVDVDDNNNAGMAEAIFALQKAAKLR